MPFVFFLVGKSFGFSLQCWGLNLGPYSFYKGKASANT